MAAAPNSVRLRDGAETTQICGAVSALKRLWPPKVRNHR
jgi:hypothetical protein